MLAACGAFHRPLRAGAKVILPRRHLLEAWVSSFHICDRCTRDLRTIMPVHHLLPKCVVDFHCRQVFAKAAMAFSARTSKRGFLHEIFCKSRTNLSSDPSHTASKLWGCCFPDQNRVTTHPGCVIDCQLFFLPEINEDKQCQTLCLAL